MAATFGRDEHGDLMRKAGIIGVVLAEGGFRPGDPIQVDPLPRRTGRSPWCESTATCSFTVAYTVPSRTSSSLRRRHHLRTIELPSAPMRKPRGRPAPPGLPRRF